MYTCRECFDAVYGSSAGAINATYFLSGQREGVHVYTDDISNKQFLDLGRLLPQNRGSGVLHWASQIMRIDLFNPTTAAPLLPAHNSSSPFAAPVVTVSQ